MWIMNVEDTDDYFFTVHWFVFSFFFWNERFMDFVFFDFSSLLTQLVYYSLFFFPFFKLQVH